MLNYYKSGDQIDYTNAGTAISAGAVVLIGGKVGVAVNAIAATTGVGPVQVRGIVKVTKVGSQAWTQGLRVYWDAGNSYFTSAGSGNTFAGYAALAVGSGSGDTTGYVLLDGAGAAVPRLTEIDDSNGNEAIKFTATTSAVNEVTLANAATGSGPSISATGGDTNVPITLAQKAAAAVVLGAASCTGVQLAADQPILDSNGAELLKFSKGTTAVNEITISSGNTGVDPALTGSGEDNVGIALVPKGTGTITFKTKVQIGTSSAALVGFYGKAPASQAAVIAATDLTAATQATTTEVRALSVAVDALVAAVKTFGLVATA